MHLGISGFYLDWIVVILFQVLLIFGVYRRAIKPDLLGFMFVFFGCGFSIVARGGIFNARLLVQVACIILAYIGYRLILILQKKLKYTV